MATVKTRMMRIERLVADLLPPTPDRCPCCQGRQPLAFSDELDNLGPQRRRACSVCGTAPRGVDVLDLPPSIAEFFADLPWSGDPVRRFFQKLMMFKAMAEKDEPAAERALRMLYERDANGVQ